MGKNTADEKILSYNDVVLRRSDLGILSAPRFLNDRIIEFYFSYLSSCYSSEDILLIPPSITFWIKECPDIANLKDFLEPLHLSNRKLVIFPINDNENVNIAEGGNHWSLLAFERNTNVFVHHDSSIGSLNKFDAKKVYNAVVQYMGFSNRADYATYIECSTTPKQVNGYDCGLYVTAIARVICRWYESNGNNAHRENRDLWYSALKEDVTPAAVDQMRNEILELIKSLMADNLDS